jgi:hypothetical protein
LGGRAAEMTDPIEAKVGWDAELADRVEQLLDGVARQATAIERERCARVALEQRCERGTPWDAACVAIATAIRTGG